VSPTISKEAEAKAAELAEKGLLHYQHWEIEEAIEAFESAVALDGSKADHFLHLAQAYMRLGDYEAMRKALGQFIHLETDPALIDRFEAFFGSAMDAVETCLTEIMAQHEVPLAVIGAAIQMWLEFRLAMGRKPINMAGIKPHVWAAALDYTVRKVNFHEVPLEKIAKWYGVSSLAVKTHSEALVEALDIMPCDYRYFRGPKNPLDKLVEAATMLEELEQRFYQT